MAEFFEASSVGRGKIGGTHKAGHNDVGDWKEGEKKNTWEKQKRGSSGRRRLNTDASLEHQRDAYKLFGRCGVGV